MHADEAGALFLRNWHLHGQVLRTHSPVIGLQQDWEVKVN